MADLGEFCEGGGGGGMRAGDAETSKGKRGGQVAKQLRGSEELGWVERGGQPGCERLQLLPLFC